MPMVLGDDNAGQLDAHRAVAVMAALDRILGSDVFRGAPQLSAFLTFVVERAVDGRSAELKGYTVAVEAFGRPPDFDPQIDPIVRVEAGRLRKALSQYYLGEGIDDPVRVTMPVGGYAPAFEFGLPAAGRADDVERPANIGPVLAPDRADPRRGPVLAGLAFLLGLAALTVWYWIASDVDAVRPPDQERVAAIQRLTALPEPAHLPVLAVATLDLPQDPLSIETARRFSGAIVDALARFDDALTVKAPNDAHTARAGADYVLELSTTRFRGAVENAVRLRAVKDGRIVWTTSNTRPHTTDPDDPELLERARRMAIRLAEPFGVIHADFRQFATSPAMRCIFQALDFRRTQKAEDHLAARTCLEGVIERDPAFQPAWPQLAFLILDEYTSDLNPHAGAPLDRALGAALNAVRLSPSSARAQQAMMAVHFARGQIEEALAAGRNAMARNPFDPAIMAGLGARLVQLNRPEEGLPLLQRAIALSNGRPPSYDFFAFLAARFTGATKLAENYVANLMGDESAFSWLGRALQAAALDDKLGLTEAIVALEGAAPAFRRDPRRFLERRGFSREVTTHIISDLGPALGDLTKPR